MDVEATTLELGPSPKKEDAGKMKKWSTEEANSFVILHRCLG